MSRAGVHSEGSGILRKGSHNRQYTLDKHTYTPATGNVLLSSHPDALVERKADGQEGREHDSEGRHSILHSGIAQTHMSHSVTPTGHPQDHIRVPENPSW